jgi:hypothetical protein
MKTLFTKATYTEFQSYGILFKVATNKKPLENAWQHKGISDPFVDNQNYAIVPNQNSLWIDIDTKHGGKGLVSLAKLCSDIGIELTASVETPSGGQHIIIHSESALDMEGLKRYYNKEYKDLEFISGYSNGYVLLPDNTGIKSKNTAGDEIIGAYKWLDGAYTDSHNSKDIAKRIIDHLLTITPKRTSRNDTTTNDDDYEVDESFEYNKEVRLEQLTKLLEYADNDDYHTWVTNGGHLKKAGGTVELFIEWSQTADNADDEDALAEKWENLPVDDGSGIGALYFNAIESKYAILKRKLQAKQVEESQALIADYPSLNTKKQKQRLTSILNEYDMLVDVMQNEALYHQRIPNSDYKYLDFFWSGKTIKQGKSEIFVENPASRFDQYLIVKKIFDTIKPNSRTLAYKINHTYNMVTEIGIGGNDIRSFPRVVKLLIGESLIINEEHCELNGLPKVDLDAIRELMPNQMHYTLERSVSAFGSKLIVNDNKRVIHSTTLQDIENEVGVSTLSDEVKADIMDEYHNHWMGSLKTIMPFMMIGKHVTNSKKNNIAVVAHSDHGKGFHFDIFNSLLISGETDMGDFCLNGKGINSFPVSSYAGKEFLTFDESGYIPRSFFKIHSHVYIREMKKHVVKVKVGGAVILTADGGIFNNNTLDSQYTNRFHIIDFRKSSTAISHMDCALKYGLDEVFKVVYHYYKEWTANELKINSSLTQDEINKKFKTLSKELDEMRLIKMVDGELVDYTKSRTTLNFFQAVEETLTEFLINGSGLSTHLEEELMKHSAYNATKQRWVIKNPTLLIPKLLIECDESLRTEFKYKDMNSLYDNIDMLEYGNTRNKLTGVKVVGCSIDLFGIELSEYSSRLMGRDARGV